MQLLKNKYYRILKGFGVYITNNFGYYDVYQRTGYFDIERIDTEEFLLSLEAEGESTYYQFGEIDWEEVWRIETSYGEKIELDKEKVFQSLVLTQQQDRNTSYLYVNHEYPAYFCHQTANCICNRLEDVIDGVFNAFLDEVRELI